MKAQQRFGVLMVVILLLVGMLGRETNAADSNSIASERVIAFLHAEVIPMDRTYPVCQKFQEC